MQIKFSKKIKVIFIIIIIIIIILLVVGIGYASQADTASQKSGKQNIISHTSISAPIENYYKVYSDPNVIYLRKSINAYLKNDSSNINISSGAIEKDVREGIISGLDSFDRSYYKSKFVVITIGNSIGGGKDIQIIFQDKPDRIFYAWIYKLSQGGYELRGFNSRENFDKQAMDKIISTYRSYIFDKNHSL
jgi:hypothetical protein